MRALVSLIILALFIGAALTLGAANGVYVQFNYLIAEDQFRLSSLMVAWFSSGLLFGILLLGWRLIKYRLQIMHLNKKLTERENALSKLKVNTDVDMKS